MKSVSKRTRWGWPEAAPVVTITDMRTANASLGAMVGESITAGGAYGRGTEKDSLRYLITKIPIILITK